MVNEKRLIWDEDAKRHLIALAIGHHSEMLHIDMILNAILYHVPTVDAVEVVHGRWIEHPHIDYGGGYNGANYECSICGFDDVYDIEDYSYCPNCGADMRERKDNNDNR